MSRLTGSGTLTDQDQAVSAYLQYLDRRASGEKSDEDPIPTLYTDLDRILIGLHPGELIIVGGRPGQGKSLFALNLLLRAAGHGYPVLFCCLEQSTREQVFRQVAHRTGLNSWRLRGGRLNDEDREKILAGADFLRDLPIKYDARSAQTLAAITGNARRLKAQGKLRLLVVDYLQLVDASAGGRRNESRHEEVGRISRRLKSLAGELCIPVVACAQLNRGPEDRQKQKPRLSDLRESGSLEQDADTVLLLHKPDEPDAERPVDRLEVHVAKNRNGPEDEVSLLHRKATFSVENDGGPAPPTG